VVGEHDRIRAGSTPVRLLRLVPAVTEFAQLDPDGRERMRVSQLAATVMGTDTDFSKDVKFRERNGQQGLLRAGLFPP